MRQIVLILVHRLNLPLCSARGSFSTCGSVEVAACCGLAGAGEPAAVICISPRAQEPPPLFPLVLRTVLECCSESKPPSNLSPATFLSHTQCPAVGQPVLPCWCLHGTSYQLSTSSLARLVPGGCSSLIPPGSSPSCWGLAKAAGLGWGGEIFVFSPLPSGKGERKREDAPGEGLSLGLTQRRGDLLAKKVPQRRLVVWLLDNNCVAWST